MTALLTVTLQTLCCIGYGAATLRLFGVSESLGWGARACWSFALGTGVLGWLLFPAGVLGLFDGAALVLLPAAGACGVIFLGRPSAAIAWPRLDRVQWALLGLLGVAAAFDLLEGLSPPADGDSLAYHFQLAKRFLGAGRLEFVPRALDGAVPLLVQMTYVPALGLGGERALTLWTFVSGWGLAALFYTVCRRHLDITWSLAATLVLVTIPAVVFGAGSGQVEARLALFAAVAAIAAASALGTGRLRYAALAGLAAGFFMGGKYTGLFFVAAVGIVLLARRGWLVRGVVFASAALVAGGQWYGWNWYHTGDPVFPLLFGWLDYGDNGYWDAGHAALLQNAFFGQEQAVAKNPLWFLLYPFVATLAGPPQFESGRTGFGPYLLLILPLALAGLWKFRDRVARSPLAPIAAIVFVFFALWFFIGSSQRVRHLLPVLPLLLVVVTTAARKWCDGTERLRPVAAALALSVVVQLAGHGLFSLNFARHVFAGQSRDAFLRRNVADYATVQWINAHLQPSDRIFLTIRNLNYLTDIPIYYAHFVQEALIDIRPTFYDPARFYRQLREQGITHLLVTEDNPPADPTEYSVQWRGLMRMGCTDTLNRLNIDNFASRTLPTLPKGGRTNLVLKLKDRTCIE